MEFIFLLIWMLGVTFSMDEMNMHFKGQHVDIIRMMDKSEGDGLQIDSIFQKGYLCEIILCQEHI